MGIQINGQNDNISANDGEWASFSNIVPSTDNTYNIGSSSLRWNEGFAKSLKLYGTTGYTQLTVPNTSSNNTFTFPSTLGSSGQVLSTDGAGILSWISLVSTQTFVVIGSTEWIKPTIGTMAIVLIWSGGGSGGRNGAGAGSGGAGGGGGGCGFGIFKLSDLPSSVTITIGAGGVGRSTNGSGSVGGDSSFGSFLTVTGGAGGASGSAAAGGDGGGFGGRGSVYGAGDGSTTKAVGGAGVFGGAGGAYFNGTNGGGNGMFGGAGGGGRNHNTSVSVGGTSFVGGYGGSGNNSGTDGVAPGGGGGGASTGTSGSGARGECRIYVI